MSSPVLSVQLSAERKTIERTRSVLDVVGLGTFADPPSGIAGNTPLEHSGIPSVVETETMANSKPGSFVHIELASTDPAKTRRFFEEVFDWEFQSIPEMNYHTYEAPSGPGGGLMTPMENQPPGILNYLLSHDLDADVKKIESAGGKILMPKMEIPGMGWWALFQEPTGLVLALYQGRAAALQRRERARPRPSTRTARKARGGKKGRGRKK